MEKIKEAKLGRIIMICISPQHRQFVFFLPAGKSIFLLLILLLSITGFAAEKMKPEDLVVRHLESIAPAETREQLANRKIGGTVLLTYRLGGSGQLHGQAILVSQGPKALLSMIFPSLGYPHEKFFFDGRSLEISQVRPGVRSRIGEFLYSHDEIIKSGILGGVLNTGWILLDPAFRNAKLVYEGGRKIDRRPVHELRIRTQKTSDLQISLLFEEGTFHHLRTQYRLRIAAPMGKSLLESASQRETYHQLIEDFADFRSEGRWTLPRQYQIQLSLEGQGGSLLIDWLLKLNTFDLQASLTDADFSIQN